MTNEKDGRGREGSGEGTAGSRPEEPPAETVRPTLLVKPAWGTVSLSPEAETMVPCPCCRKTLVDPSTAQERARAFLEAAGWFVRPPR